MKLGIQSSKGMKLKERATLTTEKKAYTLAGMARGTIGR